MKHFELVVEAVAEYCRLQVDSNYKPQYLLFNDSPGCREVKELKLSIKAIDSKFDKISVLCAASSSQDFKLMPSFIWHP
jgi:hypothetical protein